MEHPARQRSIALESVAKALAEWTVEAHVERDPSIASRYGEKWRPRWSAEVHQRLRHLAQSMAVESPALFEDSVSWAGTAFASRDVPRDDLRASLECLREVVDSHLPPPVAQEASSYLDRGLTRLNGHPEPRPDSNGSDDLELLRLRFLEAALQGRRRDAERMLVEAVEAGISVRDLYNRILQPAQAEIGRMWHADDITVAEEHGATAIVESVMTILRSRAVPETSRSHTVLFTCIAGELHTLGLRMVADFFEMDGWKALYLGANTPSEDVIHALRMHEAHVLAVSVTSILNLRALAELIEAVRAQDDLGHVRILIGGQPFKADSELWKRLGADGCAVSADEALQEAARLVGSDQGRTI